ncbi:hypothetical protein NCG97_34150 [Streptomyces lydicamycinicus]|uniref:hypothetical protein n=1 Tax=Streptomyces lydicamycinicus TaxID=1546107 RepID=UPI00203633F1|nr:hypothetical protein [Streptomyces lydicamycinicus]USA04517.1 hypothetical protein NCG97_34150 [Streptomyces lydicamycinicus]
MEPRELWERHAVLAQAFCSSDDEVRRTQGLLDEAEARRSRTLAAFAVTVGSDAVVADLLGLEEREVRLARRTVGKEDARAVAKSLLAQPPCEPAPAPQQPAPQAPAAQAPAPQPPQGAAAPGPVAPPPQQGPAAAPSEPAWAPALDAVLMSSWHNGVDLTALATELGLDVRLLVARAQQLSAESRPMPPTPSDRTGRHRRLVNVPPPQPETPHLTWRERPQQPPREHYEQEHWKQQPYQHYPDQQQYQEYRVYEEHQQYQQPTQPTWDANAITAAQHDWDGILSQWEATAAPQPPLSAPGQGGG